MEGNESSNLAERWSAMRTCSTEDPHQVVSPLVAFPSPVWHFLGFSLAFPPPMMHARCEFPWIIFIHKGGKCSIFRLQVVGLVALPPKGPPLVYSPSAGSLLAAFTKGLWLLLVLLVDWEILSPFPEMI